MIYRSYQNTKHELKLLQERLQTLTIFDEHIHGEREKLEKEINQLQKTILSMENTLKQLKGIEYELYYEIIVNGLNPTKAVDKVAFHYDKDSSTLWKKYYPNVKKYISSSEILLPNHIK